MVEAAMTDIRTIVGEPLEYFGGGIYQILLFGTERRYVGRSIGRRRPALQPCSALRTLRTVM
jgi:hypothetical protein